MTNDRIPLPTYDDLDEANRSFLETAPPLNVLRMIARTGIMPQFATPLKSIFESTWFPVEDREIMLFRTCRANGSTYEIPQHRAYGGVPPHVVDAVLDDHLDALDDWQRQLCVMADQMAKNAKLSPESVTQLTEHYGGYNMACRAILTLAWFNMLTRYVDTTGVPLEEGPDPYGGIGTKGPTDH